MAHSLKLGPKISFPLDAVTETFGLLAVRGAGKSNAAAVMAEEMYAAELPFVVIDPVAAWWGLRSAADGKGPGLPIPIFGGRHGDVPLERHGGTLIADLVVDQRLSCILDLSEFESEAAKKQFLEDFGTRLYRRNTEPLHLFLEEADDYIPQKPRGYEELLRVFGNLVRRGRARGLGITLITQRSAAINKDVLTQVQTLIPMRITAPHDRDAIEAWVRYHGESREILASLAELDNGEAWVWSPHFLGMTKRVRFRRRSTYDSGATPKMQARTRKPATLADVDLSAIQQKMQDTIERAKTTDPKLLQQQVRELEHKVKTLESRKPAAEIKKVETPIIKPAQLKKLGAMAERLSKLIAPIQTLTAEVHSLYESSRQTTYSSPKVMLTPAKVAQRLMPNPEEFYRRPDGPGLSEIKADTNGKLPEGERLILTALAQHGEMTRQQITVVVGYKRSTRDAYLARLGTKGYISLHGNAVRPTLPGFEALGTYTPLPTGSALASYWISELPEGESKILDLLVKWHGRYVNGDMLTEHTGYKRSTRDAYLARLKARQLVTGDSRHGYEASKHLFD